MGDSQDDRSDHPVLRGARDWIRVRGVKHEDLEKAWERGNSTVLRRLHGKSALGVAELDQALALAGVSRERFYRGVASGFDAELALDEIAAKNRRQVRDFLKAVRQRAPRRTYTAPELRTMAAGLNTLRFQDAAEAREQALDILRTAGAKSGDVAVAWGVLGVVERYEGRPAAAAFCLVQALEGGDDRTRAQNFQRIAMLLLCEGDEPELAMAATRRARDFYWSCRDRAGLGKVLVDEGIILGTGGAYRQAQEAHETALELLGEADFENRLGAVQGLAVSAVFLGDVQGSKAWLSQALDMIDSEESCFLHASIVWLQGEVALLLGETLEAIDHFLDVWDTYIDLDFGPLETGLVSLRIAKAYALQGDHRQVRRTLHQILQSFNEAERPSRLLGSALGEFLREGVRGKVTAEALEEIYRKTRREVETSPPLLPRTLPIP